MAGRVLVIPTVKGGVAGGWAFLDLLHKGIAPLALVFGRLNPVMVQVPSWRGFHPEGWSANALDLIRTGDRIRVDPGSKTISLSAPQSDTADARRRGAAMGQGDVVA